MPEIATLAGGCFWCTEAVFQRINGIEQVTPGYAGGTVANPSYDQVTMGNTGHAEAIQITFDPELISYQEILDIFWHTHDPTTLNQQGNDIGPQYRSVIFYHDEAQKKIAHDSKTILEKRAEFPKPIVTEIVPFSNFYVAEDYHKNYYENHKDAAYCDLVISPKIKKLMEKYGNQVKKEYIADRSNA